VNPRTPDRFAKGHGTENDFVLLADDDGELDLPAERVAALCDRRAGIGGDGLIRAVRTTALPGRAGLPGPAAPAGAAEPGGGRGRAVEWFMDYRNADGSLAEMCGNGLRVFVAYLEHLGRVRLADGDEIAVGTRAGVKRVRRDGGLLAADLGPWRVVGGAAAAERGHDAAVTVAGEPPQLPGLSIDVGNPHVVIALPDTARLAAADLTRAPIVEPLPEQGTNVELIVPLHTRGEDVGHLAMRVHERGVGETRSCGTGAVAAVLAARAWAGEGAPDVWLVDVPGGRLRVTVPAGQVLAGDAVELAGPAVIVAEGRLLQPQVEPRTVPVVPVG
jgi:diaminopimelate epimerase